MDQPVQQVSIGRAMRVIYPALLVAWLAFPAPVRDWASERAAEGFLPQAVLPLFDSVSTLSGQLGVSQTMQRLHDQMNARLDERIR